MKTNELYTVGHSTHPLEKLITLLERHQITAVGDVRSHPYSRMNPQFNRETLKAGLKEAGIAYVFLGRELGARSEDRHCYVKGRVQFRLLAKTELFQVGLSRVVQGMTRHRIALMCAEKDPLTCHRTILVCRHLIERGMHVQHILENGELESHDEALGRLLVELGMSDSDLFRSHAELVEDAYERRGQQIAYTEKEASIDEPVRGVGR